ncbi:ATP-binding protein [Marinobacterium jannaschii]|uniref:ATP-binding protein n=1 Tax=Marinobacterium jannaschii TaxID=64970 RepID=UPI0006877F18|nr:ATP-binding protein [Marinobacterium jannaschii]
METGNTPVTYSIGLKLLKHVFGMYCIAAICITLFQAWDDYDSSKNRIALRIAEQQPLVQDGLENAVWHLDSELVDSLLKGLLTQAAITGVRVYDVDGSVLAESGQMPQSGSEHRLSNQLQHNFSLYDPNTEAGLSADKIAEVVFYSNNDVLIREVKGSLIVLLLAALVKTAILWSLFIYFGRKLLSSPLNVLTSKVKSLPLDKSPENQAVTRPMNELEILEFAIEEMQHKLDETLQQLHNANDKLSSMNTHLSRAVEQSPSISAIISHAGEIIYCSPSFELQTGYDKDQAGTFFARQVFTKFPLEQVSRDLNHSHPGDASDARELQIRTLSGTKRFLSVTFSRVQIGSASVTNLLFTANDITAIKLMSQRLEKTNQEQEKIIDQLVNAKGMLLESEKMASLGQLAAGVAHEINNPIGYIASNSSALQDYVKELTLLLDSYQSLEEELSEQAADQIRTLKQQIDYDFIRNDIHNLMDDTREGIRRITDIVKDLLTYSRSGEKEYCYQDIHQGLESTLNMVWNELKYKLDLKREYGDLPEISCMISQLNQVFMNMLVNAGHAVEGNGTLVIRTRQQGDEVCIQFADDGVGIEPENIPKLFDPFFTTKPVGSGTGLGLSVSAGIIKEHNGRIEVASTPGQGSCFSIWLPVHQVRENAPPGSREIVDEPVS